MVESQKQIVVYVLGTTGVGKSQLALDICKQIGGEIINADSMQIYGGNGDGIMTARPLPGDLSEVPHHLYDFVSLGEKEFNLRKYRDIALKKIEEVMNRNKVPVVCGGTNYYIESLLF